MERTRFSRNTARENDRGDMGEDKGERDIGDDFVRILEGFTKLLGEHAGERPCLLIPAGFKASGREQTGNRAARYLRYHGQRSW